MPDGKRNETTTDNRMGQVKHYMMDLVCQASDDIETQDATEFALFEGWVKITGNLERDVAAIRSQLPDILERFQIVARENTDNNPALQELVGAISDYK